MTERKRVERSLRESEEGYRQLVDLSPDGVAVHQDGKIVFVKPSGARMLGAQSPSDLIGKPVSEVVHPDTWAAARDRIQRMLGGETSLYPVEDRYARLDGTALPVEVVASPFTFGGRPAVQVIARDISRRVEHDASARRVRTSGSGAPVASSSSTARS